MQRTEIATACQKILNQINSFLDSSAGWFKFETKIFPWSDVKIN